MTPIERAGYQAYSRLPAFARRIEEARKCIEAFLGLSSSPYVAFSAGKDSSVLLHLALTLRPDGTAKILTSGETRLLHSNLDAVLAWWRERFPALDLQEVRIDRVFSEEWRDASYDAQRKAGRGDFRFLAGSHDGVMLGLRNEESNRRRIANERKREGLPRWVWRYADSGIYRASPLARWRLNDIGAYIVAHDLPLLGAYEAEGMETRTTMRLTGDAARQNSFIHLRRRDGAAFNALLQRFPELSEWSG